MTIPVVWYTVEDLGGDGSVIPTWIEPVAVEAQVKQPEIPPEVHNPRKVDADRAMEAVRAMCG